MPRPAEGNRPRVLHVIANFYIGGSAQLVVDLIEQLGDRFDQEVVVRDLPSPPAYVGPRLHHLPRLSSREEAEALLNRLRPDFLHVHFLGHHRNEYSVSDWRWYHHFFEAAEAADCPIIQNVNIPVAPYFSPTVGRYAFVSDFVKRRFGRRGAPNTTIYPGSDLDHFSPCPSGPADDVIGMVYRLEGDKLDEQAIDAFIEMVRLRPRTRALIVGGGRYLETYRARVREAGMEAAFGFPGYVPYDELPSWIRRMSLFVAPVHTESFGQVSPFAMGVGLPIIGYDVGALPEILGGRSFLAPVGDWRRLAEIGVGLLNDRDKRLRIGAENRARALRLFSVEAMCDRYSKLYEELAEKRDGSSG